MNYDKDSFLTGLVLGRQLKGWASAGDVRIWGALEGWIKTDPGLLGFIDAEMEKEYVEVPAYPNWVKSFRNGHGSGNTYWFCKAPGDTHNYYHARAIANSSPQGVLFASDYQGTVYRARAEDHDWDNPPSVSWEDADPFFLDIYSGGAYGYFSTSMYITYGYAPFFSQHDSWDSAAVTVAKFWQMISSVSDYFYKFRSGAAIACFVLYNNAESKLVATPVLIAGNQTAIKYSTDGTTEWTGSVITPVQFGGLTFYMATTGETYVNGTITPEQDIQLLDLSNDGPIATTQDLFDAIVLASGLAVRAVGSLG